MLAHYFVENTEETILIMIIIKLIYKTCHFHKSIKNTIVTVIVLCCLCHSEILYKFLIYKEYLKKRKF